jgi:hypothetical protein
VVFKRHAQKNANLSDPIVAGVTPAPASPAKPARLPLRSSTRASARGVGPTHAAVQAVFITLLAWAALLCTGLGGTVGAVSPSLAGKVAPSAQYLQRQSGTSQAMRAVRRDSAAIVAQALATEPPPAWMQEPDGSALLAGTRTLQDRPPYTDTHLRAPIEPALKPRHRAPPGRAPPALA